MLLLPDGVVSSLVAASLQGAGPKSGYAEATGTPPVFPIPRTEKYNILCKIQRYYVNLVINSRRFYLEEADKTDEQSEQNV